MIRKTTIARAAALAIGLAACGTGAMAQSAEGSLFGRAKAGSSVTITAVDSGASRQATATASPECRWA